MSATPVYGWFGAGQSNIWGKGSTTYSVASRCFQLSPGGVWAAMGPGNMPININDGVVTLNREITTYSMGGALCDALTPIPGVHVWHNCGSNGTGSNEWNGVDLTTSPISTSTVSIVEELKLRMLNFLAMPNTLIGGVLIWQGESNTTHGASTPAEWGPDWDAICDELNGFVGASRFASSKRYPVLQLQPTYPSNMTAFGADSTEWASVRTAQADFVNTTRVADADCILVSLADPGATVTGENYHFETSALQTVGAQVGAAIVANWGL